MSTASFAFAFAFASLFVCPVERLAVGPLLWDFFILVFPLLTAEIEFEIKIEE